MCDSGIAKCKRVLGEGLLQILWPGSIRRAVGRTYEQLSFDHCKRVVRLHPKPMEPLFEWSDDAVTPWSGADNSRCRGAQTKEGD